MSLTVDIRMYISHSVRTKRHICGATLYKAVCVCGGGGGGGAYTWPHTHSHISMYQTP